jgi:predicted MPP superfamily phosphohydrolase
VRIPFYGPVVVPHGVGRYDLDFYETSGRPLYVNAGIGTYRVPWLFNCRPEITLGDNLSQHDVGMCCASATA